MEHSRAGLLPGQAPADVWSAWRHCTCGTLVWAVSLPLPAKGHLPAYGNKVVCPECGKVHVNRPFPDYQVWWVKTVIKKQVFRRWRRAWAGLWAT